MKLLNLGCGGIRSLTEEWTNLDDLHSQLPKGSGARNNLDAEPNYVNFVMGIKPLPFADGSFDGILFAHCLEHFDAQQGLSIMQNCHRLLKPGGSLLVSVPDASYFRKVYPEDRNENWPRLFDVTDPKNPIPTFFQAALWFEQHKVILTEDSLWAYFVMAGFTAGLVYRCSDPANLPECDLSALNYMMKHIDRIPFSLIMLGMKRYD